MSDAAEPPSEVEEGSAVSTLLGGAVFVAAATAVWVVLTLATDRTYHLAPVVIAAGPGVIARVSEREISWSLAVIPGLIAVAVGWAVIVAADAEPTATLAEGQPGGVEGEVIGAALIGALIGLLLSRARRPISD
jgi:hypothetical protein